MCIRQVRATGKPVVTPRAPIGDLMLHRARRAVVVLTVTAALAAGAAGPLAGPASAAVPAAATVGGVTSVPSLDLARYTGTWRQIADIPQFYEAFCVKDVTARYSVNADGTVKVDNRCTGPLGLPIRTVGTARVLDPASKAVLQVTFLSFLGSPVWPDRTPNYVVIGVAADYSWAVVGSPDRSTAYILSRTASLSGGALTAAKNTLSRNGYDPCTLTVTRQTGGATRSGPLC
jgi:apolipoprotein D and lipocalin family protein